VLAPQVLIQTVTAFLTVREGYAKAEAITAAESAVAEYINSLGISDDVIRNEIISRIQRITAIADLSLTAPANNITILDDQLARTTTVNITIT
jgi:phage-related baseplate assembly protein